MEKGFCKYQREIRICTSNQLKIYLIVLYTQQISPTTSQIVQASAKLEVLPTFVH